MELTSNALIVILSVLVILSYLYNFLSKQIKIPSVLLLISTGIILKKIAESFEIQFVPPSSSLEIMGTFGLILIVLEASLELKLTKEEIPQMRNAFLAALIILIVSVLSMAFVIQWWLFTPFKKSLVNAIPLAVISSAIAIPSVAMFNKKIKNFIIYESTFSDILGIMLFNYTIQDRLFTFKTLGNSGINIILILIISFVGSLLLLFLINKINNKVKFFLILSILFLIYAIGKEFHLPSLLLVLVFGLMINNPEKFLISRISRFFTPEKLSTDIVPFKLFTEETAFLVRTFFFILFGYSVDLDELLDITIIISGVAITLITIIIRYAYLRFTVKQGFRITKLFLAPRGLITVILFYSIPPKYILPEFGIGIVFIVIILSGLLMMISLRTDNNEQDPG